MVGLEGYVDEGGEGGLVLTEAATVRWYFS